MFAKAKEYTKYLPLLLILLTAAYLRLTNLGYADYQGDEIKALFLPENGQSVSDFLLTQRKGPVQFLITFLLKQFDQTYENQFLMRLPFALAGILAVFFFYKLVQRLFGDASRPSFGSQKIAFFAAFFLATNGFFIAFSRIVQYQSFVILFMILALYFFALFAQDARWRPAGLYLGFLSWAVSLLAHYDGVFIFPFVGYLILKGFNLKPQQLFANLRNLKHLYFSAGIFMLLLAAFYIPFVLKIDAGTQSYWLGRLSGTGGKISSSIALFRVYQPIYVIHIYFVLFSLGLVSTMSRFLKTPLLVGALFGWFLIPFVFFEAIVNIPGTHIYAYLLPLFVYLALGIDFLQGMFNRVLKLLNLVAVRSLFYIGVFMVFAFILLQSTLIYVNHFYEYPWENEPFLAWTFHKPSPNFHLSMFGFPYYRDWEGIGDYIVNGEVPLIACPRNALGADCPQNSVKIKYYSTNERSSISRYHIPFRKDTDLAGYYVVIANAQSFTDIPPQEKAAYWAQHYSPVKQVLKGGCGWDQVRLFNGYVCKEAIAVASIYYMYPTTWEGLRDLGY